MKQGHFECLRLWRLRHTNSQMSSSHLLACIINKLNWGRHLWLVRKPDSLQKGVFRYIKQQCNHHNKMSICLFIMIFLVLDYQPCYLVLSSKLWSSQQKKKKKRFTIPKSHVSSCFNMRPDANWEKNMHRDRKKEELKTSKIKPVSLPSRGKGVFCFVL